MIKKHLEYKLPEFDSFLSNSNVDLFICSTSFEERCLTIPQMLPDKIKNVRVLHFNKSYSLSNDNLDKMKNLIPRLSTITIEKNNPYLSFINLLTQLNSIPFENSCKRNVLIDISTVNREHIYLLIHIFLNEINGLKDKFNLSICYNSAKEYSYNSLTNSTKWLSKGVREIRSVLGFSGNFVPTKKLALILLTGFETQRAKKVILNFSPNKLILGHASKEDAIEESFQEYNFSIFKHINEFSNYPMEQFSFSCKSAQSTKDFLNARIKEIELNYNIVIAGLNNKISTLGIALCGLENPNVQICYPTVNQYNVDYYSLPSEDVFLFQF